MSASLGLSRRVPRRRLCVCGKLVWRLRGGRGRLLTTGPCVCRGGDMACARLPPPRGPAVECFEFSFAEGAPLLPLALAPPASTSLMLVSCLCGDLVTLKYLTWWYKTCHCACVHNISSTGRLHASKLPVWQLAEPPQLRLRHLGTSGDRIWAITSALSHPAPRLPIRIPPRRRHPMLLPEPPPGCSCCRRVTSAFSASNASSMVNANRA